jgi:hydrogenase-4 component E
MVIAKRMPALIRSFRYQSFFLCLITASAGFSGRHPDLLVVAGLILILKVFVIPQVLSLLAEKITVDENLGLFINPQLSLVIALILTYGSWIFSKNLVLGPDYTPEVAVTIAFTVISIGGFLMVCRMKAFTQVTGLLVMENGIFLLASSLCGGMPFFVEIAVFFDVFVSVIIMGLFVYRINRLFTHIDVNKLSRLKG